MTILHPVASVVAVDTVESLPTISYAYQRKAPLSGFHDLTCLELQPIRRDMVQKPPRLLVKTQELSRYRS